MLNRLKIIAIAILSAVALMHGVNAKEFNVNAVKPNATVDPLLYKTVELLPKYAEKHGIKNLTVNVHEVIDATTANESLLTGKLDVVVGGANGYLPIFAKDTNKVKLLTGWNTADLWLICVNPKIKTLRDITPETKINVKLSGDGNHLFLKNYAVSEFGIESSNKFDNNLVFMSRDQAFQILSSDKGNIDCAIIGSPYQNVLVNSGKAHIVARPDNKTTFGFPNVSYSTTKWIEENPELAKAWVEAVNAAIEEYKRDPRPMIQTYIERDKVQNVTVDDILQAKKENNDTFNTNLKPALTFIKTLLDIKLFPVSYDAIPDSQKVFDTSLIGKK
jgi:NitT/TauT family transport system substrate-binding protein